MPRGTDRSDQAARQGRLWTPALLRGDAKLVGWFDAMDVGTIATTSSAVSQWSDKSGRANHVTNSSASNRPTYGANGLKGGYPGVIHDASVDAQYLATLSFTGLVDNVSTYGVHSFTSASVSFARMTSFADAGQSDFNSANGAASLLRDSTNANVHAFAANTASTVVAISYGIPFIAGGRITTTTKGVAVNGTLATQTAMAARAFASPTRFAIGGEWTGAGIVVATRLHGVTAEVVVCKDETTRDRERLEGYLAWKWALVDNLPASHTYKNRPPLIGD